jgi:hypothetical protein
MEAFFVICGLPLALYAAGFATCYIFMVRYKLRFDRREDEAAPTLAAPQAHRAGGPLLRP